MTSYAHRVQVQMPPAEDAGEDDEKTYVTVAHGATPALARLLAYAIAIHGVPARWLEEYTKGEGEDGKPTLKARYLSATVERAQTMGEAHAQMVKSEAMADRAVLTAREMRGKERIGPMLGELTSLSHDVTNTTTKRYLREGILALAKAVMVPVIQSGPGNYGLEYADNAEEIARVAAEAWQVEPFSPTLCSDCGGVHPAQNGEDIAALLAKLFAIDGEEEAQPAEPMAPHMQA